MSTNRATWRRPSRSSSALALFVLLSLTAGAAHSAAGERIALAFERSRGGPTSVWVARADGSGPRRLIRNAFGPQFSPDGRRLAYLVPGRFEAPPVVYVRTLASGATRRLGPAFGAV
jgi:hypothetical protein